MSKRQCYKREWMQINRNIAKSSKPNPEQESLTKVFERSYLEATSSAPVRSTVSGPNVKALPAASYRNSTASPDPKELFHVAESGNIDTHIPLDVETTEATDDTDFWSEIDEAQNPSLDSSESDDEIPQSVPVTESSTLDKVKAALSEWAVEENITHKAVESLLAKLKSNVPCLSSLPITARSLLRTPLDIVVKKVSDMDYYHFGLRNQLTAFLATVSPDHVNTVGQIDLVFNIDGIPLFRSSKVCLWPILCRVANLKPYPVFPVTLTCGPSKPNGLDFLDETIREIKDLMENGFCHNGRVLKVNLKCVVCDAPAKAFVKVVKLCSGYYGCDKCTQKGEWSTLGRKVVYKQIACNKRSDDAFRLREQEGHHHGISPFSVLPIDMVRDFPIDYMHQVCLGVVRRLVLMWLRGPKTVKMSAVSVKRISDKMLTLKGCIPSVFARKPRPLNEIDLWKATEFRQFLLYTGAIVLKGILRPDLYLHFMKFSVALSILVSPGLAAQHRLYAQELLEDFVRDAMDLYGEPFLVYNVHSLLHVSDEVVHFGSLDNCAAWPFEDHLQKMKKKVRSGKNPLVQIVKRLGETNNFGTVESDTQARTLSQKAPDNTFRLENGTYVEIVSYQSPNYLCRTYRRLEPIFKEPCDSKMLRHGRVKKLNSSMKLLNQDVFEGAARCIQIKHDPWVSFLCLLHEH